MGVYGVSPESPIGIRPPGIALDVKFLYQMKKISFSCKSIIICPISQWPYTTCVGIMALISSGRSSVSDVTKLIA